jgi:hypothetical protein
VCRASRARGVACVNTDGETINSKLELLVIPRYNACGVRRRAGEMKELKHAGKRKVWCKTSRLLARKKQLLACNVRVKRRGLLYVVCWLIFTCRTNKPSPGDVMVYIDETHFKGWVTSHLSQTNRIEDGWLSGLR